jgi:hypothetical protein
LSAVGYSLDVDGSQISVENGYIHSNGFISKYALEKCFGIIHPETYSSLWGRKGKVLQRVREKLSKDPDFRIDTVIDRIREAAEFRRKDLVKHCKIRGACKVALAKFVSQKLGLRVKENCVDIIDVLDKLEKLEVEFAVEFSSLKDAERAVSVVVSAEKFPSLFDSELRQIKGLKKEDVVRSMALTEETTIAITGARALPSEENQGKFHFSGVLVFVGGVSSYEDLFCLLSEKEREMIRRHEYQRRSMLECLESLLILSK